MKRSAPADVLLDLLVVSFGELLGTKVEFQHIKTQKSKSVRESVCTVEAGLCSLSVNEKEVAHARLIRVWEV